MRSMGQCACVACAMQQLSEQVTLQSHGHWPNKHRHFALIYEMMTLHHRVGAARWH